MTKAAGTEMPVASGSENLANLNATSHDLQFSVRTTASVSGL